MNVGFHNISLANPHGHQRFGSGIIVVPPVLLNRGEVTFILIIRDRWKFLAQVAEAKRRKGGIEFQN